MYVYLVFVVFVQCVLLIKMPQLIINDITIEFPFDPYPVQTAYMQKVIECLNAGGNAALESPTGSLK